MGLYTLYIIIKKENKVCHRVVMLKLQKKTKHLTETKQNNMLWKTWTALLFCSQSMTKCANLRNDSFDHNVFNLLPDQSGVDSPRTKILPQGLQSPENTHIQTHALLELGSTCSYTMHVTAAKTRRRFRLHFYVGHVGGRILVVGLLKLFGRKQINTIQ